MDPFLTPLRVDLDTLQTTILTYNTEITNLYAARSAIIKSLTSLKASGWDSGAGKTWFSLLDDEWLKNINYQIRVLGRLRDNLSIAKDEYQQVYAEQQALKDYL